MVQWLRICLPVPGTQEDSTCCGATACVPQILKPMSSRSGELQLLSLCAATGEAKRFFFFLIKEIKKSIQAGTLGLSQADRPSGKIYNYKDICLKKKS